MTNNQPHLIAAACDSLLGPQSSPLGPTRKDKSHPHRVEAAADLDAKANEKTPLFVPLVLVFLLVLVGIVRVLLYFISGR